MRRECTVVACLLAAAACRLVAAAPRQLIEFAWPTGTVSPFPFWYEEGVGLFVVEQVTGASVARADGAKRVYCITPAGERVLLCRTDTVARLRLGRVTTGWPVAADATGAVWIEVLAALDRRRSAYCVARIGPTRGQRRRLTTTTVAAASAAQRGVAP